MMNTNELYKEYARVIEMCEGTELEDTPWVCIRSSITKNHYIQPPSYHEFLSSNQEFAIAVLEGKPVFVDDVVYAKSPNVEMAKGAVVSKDVLGNIDLMCKKGTFISLKAFGNSCLDRHFTWTPPAPKRTFTLNGVELPCPCKLMQEERCCYILNINDHLFRFDNQEDKNACYSAIINLITEARDK